MVEHYRLEMDYSHNRFGVLRDLHPHVEVLFNRLSLAGVVGSLGGFDGQNASLAGSDRASANNILLRNEIYDLFKKFYRKSSRAAVLDEVLGDIGEFPFLQIIAQRMELEVEEQKKAVRSAMV